MMKSFFLLPVHNKEFLLKDVLTGIVESVSNDYHVIVILDGCTDNSENILAEFIDTNKLYQHFTFLEAPDVHEITSLNMALMKCKEFDIKGDKGINDQSLIFTLQDDIILQQPSIDEKFNHLFKMYTDLGYVSMRLGASLHPDFYESNYVESEFGHWKQLGLQHFSMLEHYDFITTDIAIRSPTCVQWKRYKEIGFYDSALAPCGYDCHDFSIRMNQANYKNAVYALKFESKVEWGGMRANAGSNVNSKYGQFYEYNRRYLTNKHKAYFQSR